MLHYLGFLSPVIVWKVRMSPTGRPLPFPYLLYYPYKNKGSPLTQATAHDLEAFEKSIN